MRKAIFSLIFVLAVGVAFLVTTHFITGVSHPQKQVWSNVRACNMSCCLPDDIKLSPSQKEQLQNLEKTYCQCRDTLSVQIDKKRLAVADLLLRPNPDSFAIDNLLQEIANLQIQLEKQTIHHILEIKNQLPPHQQNQFLKTIVNEIRRRCHHHELLEEAS